MRFLESLALRDRLVSRVNDALYWSERGKETSSELTARLLAVYRSEPACKRTPQWLRAYIDGYVDAKLEPLKRSMVYGAWLDGQFYDATNRTSPNYVDNRGMTWREFGEITDGQSGALVGYWWPSDLSKPWYCHVAGE